MTNRAFLGEVHFKIKLAALEVSMTRIIRATYAYTPEWPYWTSRKKEVAAEPGLDLALHLLAHHVPRGGLEAIHPTVQRWVPIDDLLVRGILKPGVYMHVKTLIDREARLQDNANRVAADAPPAPCHQEFL